MGVIFKAKSRERYCSTADILYADRVDIPDIGMVDSKLVHDGKDEC
jgi:hypothetical protein